MVSGPDLSLRKKANDRLKEEENMDKNYNVCYKECLRFLIYFFCILHNYLKYIQIKKKNLNNLFMLILNSFFYRYLRHMLKSFLKKRVQL